LLNFTVGQCPESSQAKIFDIKRGHDTTVDNSFAQITFGKAVNLGQITGKPAGEAITRAGGI
jgi:hypothetical protein